MGKKSRTKGHSSKHEDGVDSEYSGSGGGGNNGDGKQHHPNDDNDDDDEGNNNNNPKYKDLNFAQRRDLQRQLAAEKRRNKMRCHLCGESGHVRRDCPGIADDGRGMSRYKGKSDPRKEKENYRARKYGQGCCLAAADEKKKHPGVEFPSEFYAASSREGDENGSGELPLVFYDAGCNVAATMDYLRSGRGKHKLSHKEALEEYHNALGHASTKLGLGGLISETYLHHGPTGGSWKEPLPSENIPVRSYYVLSLTRSFKCNTDEMKHQVTQGLLKTLESNPSKIIGFKAELNYTPKHLAKDGSCVREEQLERLRCTIDAAGQSRLPLKIQTSPGAAGLDPELQSVAGTPYAAVLLDLHSIISDSLSKYPDLKIHLSCWSGRADHMMSMLNAFRNNVVIGLDGSVSFTKAKHLHECCFEVPMDRFVLETSTTIPAGVANSLKRDAAFHSGWWPHVADAVACHKKIPVMDAARAATETALRIYPQLLVKSPAHGNVKNGCD